MRSCVFVYLVASIFFGQVGLAEDRIEIVTSIPPITSLVRSIVKSKGTTTSLLDRTMDHHLVELRPSDVMSLSSSDLVLLNGLGLEFWAKSLPIEISKKTVSLFRSDSGGHGDVHAWLSPSLIVESIPNLVSELCKLQPTSCDEFKKNGEETSLRIISARDRIRSRVSKLSNKEFLGDHATWSLFAKDVGLIQAFILRRSHEDTVTIQDVAAFSKEALKLKKRLFIIEPSTSRESIKSLSTDLSLEILELDPLGNGTADYGVFIEQNADKILLALERK